MKRIALCALTLTLAASVLAPTLAFAKEDDMFVDVPKDHWAYKAVKSLKEKGILTGYTDADANRFIRQAAPPPKAKKPKAKRTAKVKRGKVIRR